MWRSAQKRLSKSCNDLALCSCPCKKRSHAAPPNWGQSSLSRQAHYSNSQHEDARSLMHCLKDASRASVMPPKVSSVGAPGLLGLGSSCIQAAGAAGSVNLLSHRLAAERCQGCAFSSPCQASRRCKQHLC